MDRIANLLFEAKILKELPRAGYHFLGAGKETVAEHSFMITFISYVMAKMEPDVDELKLIKMSLMHDLSEARIGDLNYVQKKYVKVDEEKAVKDATKNVPFGAEISTLIDEFNKGETLEAKLSRDADQISFILELKSLNDVGNKSSGTWLPTIIGRLQTDTGKKLTKHIMATEWDAWWRKNYIDE